MKTCSIQGCNRPHYGRSWCHLHYQRWQSHGNPVAKVPRRRKAYACSVDSCGAVVHARGLCRLHYIRWQRHGSADWNPPTTADRFWAKVDKSAGPDGCWLWTAHRGLGGYGSFHPQGATSHVAHKWAWEQENGPVPPGKQLDHFACDNPPCVNPAHVRPVTPRENTLRSRSLASIHAAKTHCVNGHEFTSENTRTDARGWRWCRACQRLRSKQAKLRHL